MSFGLYIGIFIGLVVVAVFVSILYFNLETKKDFKQKLQSDITLEQMLGAEEVVETFYRENKLHRGCELDTIANALLVKRGTVDPNLTTAQAHLSDPGADGYRVVTFRVGLGETEKRFLYAHECAHVLNHDVTPATRPEGHNKPPCEQIADYTAAAFLMPFKDVQSILQMHNYASSSKKQRIKVLRLLCKQYKVSEMVAIRRISEVEQLNRIMKSDDAV